MALVAERTYSAREGGAADEIVCGSRVLRLPGNVGDALLAAVESDELLLLFREQQDVHRIVSSALDTNLDHTLASTLASIFLYFFRYEW